MEKRNYYVRKWNNELFAIIPEDFSELFRDMQIENLSDKANVLIYVDEKSLDTPKDFAIYLAYLMVKNPYLRVYISTKKDAGFAECANVIINGLKDFKNENFFRDLSELDNKNRIFLNVNEIEKIGYEKELICFIKKIKNCLIKKRYSEGALLVVGK